MATVSTMTRKSALPVDGINPYTQQEGEEYMNDDQKAHFHKILSAWKQSLVAGVNKTVSHMKEDAAHFADPADRATQEEEFALELRNRDRERKLVRKIDKTLNFIETEDFGYCEACGVEIGLQRLEVRPTAELCIDCKTTQEIKERQLA
jgi:DnaK suppressor protein